MKNHLGFMLVWLLVAAPARAGIVVSFDENGTGRVVAGTPANPQVGTFVSLGNIPDPIDPASGLKPLAYDMNNALLPNIYTLGDIFIPDATSSTANDLIRFAVVFPVAGGKKSYLLVYSDADAADPNAALADVGVPTNAQVFGTSTTNVRTITEQGPESGPNGITYTPTVGLNGTLNDPGFFTGSGIDVTYAFMSDDIPPPEPEPASIVLFGSGLVICGLFAISRRRRHGEIQRGAPGAIQIGAGYRPKPPTIAVAHD